MCEALDKIYLERHGKELEAAIQARIKAEVDAGIQDAMKKGLLEGERKGFIKSQQTVNF